MIESACPSMNRIHKISSLSLADTYPLFMIECSLFRLIGMLLVRQVCKVSFHSLCVFALRQDGQYKLR
jgi:hypothetical protein